MLWNVWSHVELVEDFVDVVRKTREDRLDVVDGLLEQAAYDLIDDLGQSRLKLFAEACRSVQVDVPNLECRHVFFVFGRFLGKALEFRLAVLNPATLQGQIGHQMVETVNFDLLQGVFDAVQNRLTNWRPVVVAASGPLVSDESYETLGECAGGNLVLQLVRYRVIDDRFAALGLQVFSHRLAQVYRSETRGKERHEIHVIVRVDTALRQVDQQWSADVSPLKSFDERRRLVVIEQHLCRPVHVTRGRGEIEPVDPG